MKALKGLVFGMGLLIITGLGLLGYGLSTTQPNQEAYSNTVADTNIPAKGFGHLNIPEKTGSAIIDTAIHNQNILIHVQGNGPDRVHVINIASGQYLGVISLLQAQP